MRIARVRLLLSGPTGPSEVTRLMTELRSVAAADRFRVFQENLRVRDQQRAEVQRTQVGQSPQVYESGVGDLCAFEVQQPQAGHPTEVHEPGVGNPGIGEVQAIQFGQLLEMRCKRRSNSGTGAGVKPVRFWLF